MTLLPEGQQQVSVCGLRRQGDTVLLEHHYVDLPSLAAVDALPLPAEAPVYLIVLGRGVLTKTVAASASPETAATIATVLPGATAADFYAQQLPGPDGQHWALIRRATVEPLLAALQQQGRYVVDAAWGPLCFAALLPYLPAETATYVASGYALIVQPPHVLAVQPAAPEFLSAVASPLRVGEQEVQPELLLPYAGALSLLTGVPPVACPAEPIAHGRDEWQQRQRFRRNGLLVLAAFFTVLLLNFGLFTHLTARQQQLASQGVVNQSALARLEALQQRVQQQQQFVTGAGWAAPTRHSVRADALAATVPAGLQLLTLDSTPLDAQQTTQQQHPVFLPGILRVKGQCREASVLNEWLQRVSRLPWVRAVRDQHFSYDYSAGTGTFTFTVHTAAAPGAHHP